MLLSGSPTPIPTPSWDPRCGFLWSFDPTAGLCYLITQEFTTWNDARTTCEGYGSSLASITTPHEQSFITGRIHNIDQVNFWIGINDRGQRDFWEWIDKAPVAYVNWDSGYPVNKDSADCGVYDVPRASWQTRNCDKRYGYICKKPALPPSPVTPITTSPKPTPTTTRDGFIKACPKGWKPWQQKCYIFFQDKAATWDAAKSACKFRRGDLVSIMSKLEQDYVEAKVKEIFKGTGDKPEDGVWLGLNAREHSNWYRWSDASSVSFTYWGPHEPNNWDGRNQNCVQMRIKSGRWKDQQCDDTGRGYVCKMDKIDVPKPPITTPKVIEGCPKATSFDYRDACYMLRADGKDWNAAQQICTQSYKGNLVDILDRFEQAYISSQFAELWGDWWLGYTNLNDANGKWRWSSRRLGQYTNWARDHDGNERNKCAIMKTDKELGLWRAVDCKTKYPFICKSLKYGSTIPPTSTPTKPVYCPPFWKDVSGYCYKAFKNYQPYARKHWSEAVDHCRSMGAHIASFHTKSEVDAVGPDIGYGIGGAWIGLNTRGTDGKYKWADNTATDFFYWQNGQPVNHNKEENCIEMDNKSPYRWRHSHCDLARNWICKIKKGGNFVTPTTPPPTVRPDKHCGTDRDWYYYNGHCYYVQSSSKYSWYSARDDCMKNGGDLSSIHGSDANSWLTRLVSKTSTREYWIGLNYLDKTQYRWSDTTTSDYFNWASGEPNDHHYGQLCVNLYSFNGFWNDDNCADKMGYICRKYNGTLTPKTHPVTTPAQGYCPSGFYGIGNKCFSASGFDGKERQSFDKAANICRSLGKWYDLASINNQAEQAIVNALVSTGTFGFWIGLTNRVLNRLQWLDNSDLTYVNWDRGQPSYGSKCTEVQVGKHYGLWTMSQCYDKKGYICEYFKRSDGKIVTTGSLPPNKCMPGYTPYKEHCFKLLTASRTFNDAEDACVKDYGHLSSIQDMGENSFVALFLMEIKGPVWIGLRSPMGVGQYEWTDSWRVRFTYWAPGNPENAFTRPCGVMLDDGRWNGTECERKYPGICRTTSVNPPPTPPYVPGKCPDTKWTKISKFCYKPDMTTRKSYTDSVHSCFMESSSLASIHSRDENEAIFQVIQDLENQKTGLWLGLLRKNEKAPFAWYDGTDLVYTNWASDDETKPIKNRNCVHMDPKTGMWRSAACYMYNGRICKTDIIPFTVKPGPSTTTQPSVNPASTTTPSSTTGRSTLEPSVKTPKSTTVVTRKTVMPKTTQSSGDPGGLSAGGKVGLAFGVVALVLLVLIVITVILKRRQQLPYSNSQNAGQPNYGESTGFSNMLYTPPVEQPPGFNPANIFDSGFAMKNIRQGDSFS